MRIVERDRSLRLTEPAQAHDICSDGTLYRG